MPDQTNQHNTALAVAYLRARHTDQRQALVHQSGHCRIAAERLGAQLIAEYADIGSSGAPHRPGLNGLIKRLQAAPEVRFVLVDGLDRLTRRSRTLLTISDAITANGAVLVDTHHIPSEQRTDSRAVIALRSHVRALLAAHGSEHEDGWKEVQ